MEWTGAKYADKPTVQVQTWINASPEEVWRVVADVEAMPSMSNELQRVEWQDGATSPSVGATFVGYSKHNALGEWSTTSYIVECAEPEVLGWAVADAESPSSLWRFTLQAKDGGTELTQWMQLGPGRSGLSFAIDRMPEKEEKIIFVRLREFEKAITHTLDQIKTLAEQD
jgi:uncharacterized protein YndB with AHSA1/START domain